jgi:hypothetical protein
MRRHDVDTCPAEGVCLFSLFTQPRTPAKVSHNATTSVQNLGDQRSQRRVHATNIHGHGPGARGEARAQSVNRRFAARAHNHNALDLNRRKDGLAGQDLHVPN